MNTRCDDDKTYGRWRNTGWIEETTQDPIGVNAGCSNSKDLKLFGSSVQKYFETKILKTFILDN